MRRLMVLLGAILMVVAACGGSSGPGRTQSSSAPPTAQNFGVRGPHAVGVIRLRIDTQRPVEVFYPADRRAVRATAAPYRYTPEDTWGSMLAALPAGLVKTVYVPGAWFDVPASAGRFPLVVFSHGLGLMRFSYTFHAAHLASWGYVVALPEIPTRDLHARLSGGTATGKSDVATILDTIALLARENARSGSVLEGRVNSDQVAVEGHSAGGRDAALAAYSPKVDAWIGDAPAVPVPDNATDGRDIIKDGDYGFNPAAGEFNLNAFLASATPPDKPSMIIAANRDVIYPVAERQAVYNWLPAPKRLVVLANTGHSVFINDCSAWQKANRLAIADALGFSASSIERTLLQNGCLSTYAPVQSVWATWDHLTVAQLNLVFGINPATASASLEQSYLDETFPGRIAHYEVQP